MFEPGMVQTLVEGVRDTLYMVLASTAFGYLLGLPLGILLCITGENGIRRNPVIYRILDIVVNLIRSVPFLILLILVSPFTKWLVGKSYGATATVVSLLSRRRRLSRVWSSLRSTRSIRASLRRQRAWARPTARSSSRF